MSDAKLSTNRQPKLGAIVWNDWPALAASVFAPINWLLVAFHPKLFGPGSRDTYVLVLAALLTLLCILVLIWRCQRIFRLFELNTTAAGYIHTVKIVKDRGRLEFWFRLGEQTIASWTPIHKSRRTRAMYPGMPITVYYDPDEPKRAIIGELFT